MAFGNRHSSGTIWLPSGNPETTSITTDDFNSMGGQPGSLGLKHESGNPLRTYQRVQLDSGATAATPSGAVLASQVAYWKDKASYIVTNDSRFAMGGASAAGAFRNYIAGVFPEAKTAGRFVDIAKRAQNYNVRDGGNTFAAGELVFAENDTTAAAADRAAVGTYPGVKVIGVARGAAANGLVAIDLDIVDDDQ